MTQAKKDDNQVNTMIGASSSDGTTPINVKVNPTSHIVQVSDNGSGIDLSGNIASRDENFVPVLMGVSSADGVTPTAIYVDTNGNLLIKST